MSIDIYLEKLNQPIGKLEEVEYFGYEDFWEIIEFNKVDIPENLYNKFREEGKSKYIGEVKEMISYLYYWEYMI